MYMYSKSWDHVLIFQKKNLTIFENFPKFHYAKYFLKISQNQYVFQEKLFLQNMFCSHFTWLSVKL